MLGLLVFHFVASAPTAEALITEQSLRAHIRFLASDLLEGRAPGSVGDRLAEAYIAAQFEADGLTRAGTEWLQPVELIGVSGSAPSVTFSAPSGASLTLNEHDDYMFVSGHQGFETVLANTPLVFVGYGIVAPEFKWNDFKDVSVKGKVVVVLNNDPEDDPGLFGGRARLWYGRWDYKFQQARKMGAVGCLIIHTTHSAGYPWQVVQTSWAGEQFSLPNQDTGLQIRGWLTEEATRRLLALSKLDLDRLSALAQSRAFRPVSLGLVASTTWQNTVSRKLSGNVLGVLPGSDPQLKNEYIVVTAHHDHLGKKVGAKPGVDAIYNGAVDNASGVAALLTIAHALALQPLAPKRSILFAAVAAEEQGLLGSEWLVSHAPVPVAAMAANLNIDGLNIWGRTRDVSVIGLGKSSIDVALKDAAARQGRVIKPDALSDRGFFYRSDQFNFARVGVPSAYFSSGQDFIDRPAGWGGAQRERWEASTYHQPSDELRDDWDLTGAVEDVRLELVLAVELANAPTMPKWTPGDEFESTRLRSQSLAPASP